jgi:hypothetical protein
MSKRFFALAFMLMTFSIGFSVKSAEAKQCIYNNSGTLLKVTWYNGKGDKDKRAFNGNLSVMVQTCQENPKLGFAVIECEGCAWAEAAAKMAIIAGATGAFGVCAVGTAGECLMVGELFVDLTIEAVKAIPSHFAGKMVVVPNKGKTIRIEGPWLGLKVGK